MEISKTKEKFLSKLGIDIENLPEEFKKIAKDYGSSLTREERDFLFSDSYTKEFVLPFSMKDIVGTSHPSYKDKTYYDAFISSARGDENIEKFFSNPTYYSETLKQENQSSKHAGHDTPIELNRDAEGNLYIMGGNNRLNIIMMLYLKELSCANTKEEKDKINEKYTFYGEIRSLPKNKDVNNIIFMLEEIYEDNIKFSFQGKNPDDCHYRVKIYDQEYEITNILELKNLLIESYSIEGLNAINLYNKLTILIYNYNHGKSNDIKMKLFNEICPNIEEVKELFLNLRILNNSYTIFVEVDLSNIDYSNISEFLKMVTYRVKEGSTELSDTVPSSPKM